ncbi:hypothetical protein SNEBB_000899 [Seison nebaliae]|nr:hypothetical protein SNEBB_000899 [Seison nebaliae]
MNPTNNVYNSNVLLGNWYEESMKNKEDLDKLINNKLSSNSTTSQKEKFLTLSKQSIPLTILRNGNLKNCSIVQLLNVGGKTENGDYVKRRVLSVANDLKFKDFGFFATGASVENSMGISRSAVKIRCDRLPDESPLTYYTKFHIVSCLDEELLLKSQCISNTFVSAKSGLQPVIFSNEKDDDCLWMVEPLNPNERLCADGKEINTEIPLVIKHVKTGKFLGNTGKQCKNSLFGTESELLCHNYLNTHRVVDVQNRWQIIGNKTTFPNEIHSERMMEMENNAQNVKGYYRDYNVNMVNPWQTIQSDKSFSMLPNMQSIDQLVMTNSSKPIMDGDGRKTEIPEEKQSNLFTNHWEYKRTAPYNYYKDHNITKCPNNADKYEVSPEFVDSNAYSTVNVPFVMSQPLMPTVLDGNETTQLNHH